MRAGSMARTTEAIVQMQIGGLMLQLAEAQNKIEERDDKILELEIELQKYVRNPDTKEPPNERVPSSNPGAINSAASRTTRPAESKSGSNSN
jgi:hypothetical protein